ncbi:hypothetical protein BH23BAC4_BH23BAC4_11950 [soil metagenome]
MKLISTALAVFLLAGCAQAQPAVQVEPDQAFRLLVGETAQVVAGPTITFLTIERDSRCPANVQCVWAGEAIALFRVAIGSQATEIRMVIPGGRGVGTGVDLSSGGLLVQRLGPYPGTPEAAHLAPTYAVLRFLPATD